LDKFLSFWEYFLNLADFHVDILFIKRSDDHFGG
jgi:hypothetical protein